MAKFRRTGSPHWRHERDILAYEHVGYYIYSQCDVNEINFVAWQRDQNWSTTFAHSNDDDDNII